MSDDEYEIRDAEGRKTGSIGRPVKLDIDFAEQDYINAFATIGVVVGGGVGVWSYLQAHAEGSRNLLEILGSAGLWVLGGLFVGGMAGGMLYWLVRNLVGVLVLVVILGVVLVASRISF